MNILVTHGPHAGRIFEGGFTLSSDKRYMQVDINNEIVEFKFGLDCEWETLAIKVQTTEPPSVKAKHATIKHSALTGIVYAESDTGALIINGTLESVIAFCKKWGYTEITQQPKPGIQW